MNAQLLTLRADRAPRVLVAYTDDESGVLNRVASLFRRRAFNIHSLTVGPTETPGESRMTLVVDTDEAGLRRAAVNLAKLLNVRKVECLAEGPALTRDLALIRVRADAASRSQVLQLAQAFRASVIDIATDSLIVECTGAERKIDALVDALRPFGILEMGRTGVVAMARGAVPAARGEAEAVNFL